MCSKGCFLSLRDLRGELWQPLLQLFQHSHLQHRAPVTPRDPCSGVGSRKEGGGLGAPFGVQNINFNFPDSLEQEQLDMSTGTDSRSYRKRGKLLREGMFPTALADPL